MKIKIYLYALILILIAIFQSTLADYMTFYGIKPNIIIVFVIAMALLRGNLEGATVGFFAGLLQDIISGRILGFYALLGVYLGLLVGSINRRIYRENIFVFVFFVFSASFVYEFIVCFFGVFLTSHVDLIYAVKYYMLPEAIYNSIISIVMYFFVIKLHRKLDRTKSMQRRY